MREDPDHDPIREQTSASAPPMPDPNATGSGAPLPTSGGRAPDHHVSGRESQERDAARRRGRDRRATDGASQGAHTRFADPGLARLAFTALAENVRDYAVFLMDADGIIRYWGEGAHLMKRWTREEAEGGHLRLLYPDGGAEDGTAEDHLREAAAKGESVSEGHRVRGDGTTFWAHITLTALISDDGILLGFAKVTRDITVRHAAEAAFALTTATAELARSHGEHVSMLAEIEVLKEELSVLQEELRSRDEPAGGR